ncbi:hypothetical protein BCR35DRAFT_341705 [Leucosporidium creatinivorum]|uniref:FAR1 domain-containing protein n=1 Tax=Leucosporidium creatinivorum TaxID=106004 RepID=A0A1Y2F7B4_9BASI|nr:hypothetical protein BCR35DRAFT_341705 [Leucosporidium creatinivorum]
MRCHHRGEPGGCTFRLTCSGRKGGLIVTRRETSHSCGKEKVAANQKLARERMGVQLDKLKVLAEVANATMDGDGAEEPEGGDLSFEDSESSDGEVEGLAIVSREATGGIAETQSTTAQSPSLVHPKVASLVPMINRLAQSGPIELPSSLNSISSASYTELRIRVVAAALQQGFALVLYNRHITTAEKTQGTAFALRCVGRGKEGEGHCGAYVKIKKQDDGDWMVVENEESHNHPLGPKMTAWPSQSRMRELKASLKTSAPGKRGRKELRSDSESSDAGASKRLRYPSRPRSSSATLIDEVSTHPKSSAPAVFLPPPPPINHAFLPTLILFLQSITTSPSRITHASTLLQAGFDSTEKLVLLLSLEDDSIDRYAGELGERFGLPRIQQALLRKAVKDAKRMAREGSAEERIVKMEAELRRAEECFSWEARSYCVVSARRGDLRAHMRVLSPSRSCLQASAPHLHSLDFALLAPLTPSLPPSSLACFDSSLAAPRYSYLLLLGTDRVVSRFVRALQPLSTTLVRTRGSFSTRSSYLLPPIALDGLKLLLLERALLSLGL